MRVIAALSGGVDSAVAAARVMDQGHTVLGVRLDLSNTGNGAEDDDARRVADLLGIPYEVWDMREDFERIVVDEFLSEYRQGRTPNPCVRCNQRIKFGALMDRALSRGFDAICTGHYARIERPHPDTVTPAVDPRGSGQGETGVELHRAASILKDQSYVLAAVGLERLSRALFPLGHIANKDDVRAEAAARGLGVSAKADSLDICFISDGDATAFLLDRLGEQRGIIVDEAGAVVGSHAGAFAFTIGQRKGLRLPRPAADGAPRYVTGVHVGTNTVEVGPERLLSVTALEGASVVWLAPDVPAIEATPCHVQVRAHGIPAHGHVTITGDAMVIELDEPMRAVAPGQAMVVYSGTRVLGQATVVTRGGVTGR
jgi:tRNA-specific 2-thiouridylase